MQVGPGTYNHLGDAYARANENGIYNAFYERPSTLALLPEVKGKRVLDLGCGPGVYSEILLQRGAIVTAVDGSEKMVELAEARLGKRAKVVLADFAKPLSFLKSGSFDLVLSTLAIHYVENLSQLAQEIYRLLSPTGMAVVSTEHPGLSYDHAPNNNYFLCQAKTETWKLDGDQEYEVSIYRRPLTQMLQPFLESEFTLDMISEGVLTEKLQKEHPEFHALFLRKPPFIFFRWKKT